MAAGAFFGEVSDLETLAEVVPQPRAEGAIGFQPAKQEGVWSSIHRVGEVSGFNIGCGREIRNGWTKLFVRPLRTRLFLSDQDALLVHHLTDGQVQVVNTQPGPASAVVGVISNNLFL